MSQRLSCYSKGPGFDSQHAVQLSVTLILSDLTPPSGLCRYLACTQCTDTHAGKHSYT